MRIADGVEMLEIPSMSMTGTPSVIYPVLIWDKDNVILVDTGFPGQLPQIHEVFEKTGVAFNRLNMIILTHHDIDHIGNLSAILSESPGVKVLSHEEERPYIQGDKSPIKLAQMEAQLDELPPEIRVFYEKLKSGFESRRAKVDIVLRDGEELPYCGGITVIHTPGHTHGHICLYLKQSKVAITGDMLTMDGGALVPSASRINYDNDMNLKSIGRLAEYDIKAAITYHGGLYKDNVNSRIKELING